MLLVYGGADGRRYWIVWDGTLYNFLELREELEALGHRFRTQTDTEVLIAAYAEWGANSLLRFNGVWALAIWDSQERRLILSRDHFGVRPLYFWFQGTRLAFASEIKAFLALDGFAPALDQEVARLTLTEARTHEGTKTETVMRGVHRLPPGSILMVQPNGQITMSQWWNTLAHPLQIPQQYEDQVLAFRNLFFDAVRIRLRSDVPVGACLGGGVASGAVVSSMAWLYRHQTVGMERTATDWKHSFTASFPDTAVDERRLAAQIAEHAGMESHYWSLSDQEAQSQLLEAVWSLEEIQPEIVIPSWGLYRELRREKVTVSLDGYGSDELLGGYDRHLDVEMQNLNETLYRDVHQASLPSILRECDRCSMAHGVEMRLPFLDWRLVRFATALAGEAKIGGDHTKRILRDAMVGIMPEAVRRRQAKVTLNTRMMERYGDSVSPLLRKAVSHPLWQEIARNSDPGLRGRILAKLESGGWTSADWRANPTVWPMVNLVLWHSMFVEGRSPGSMLAD